jgi:hypothetical protein
MPMKFSLSRKYMYLNSLCVSTLEFTLTAPTKMGVPTEEAPDDGQESRVSSPSDTFLLENDNDSRPLPNQSLISTGSEENSHHDNGLKDSAKPSPKNTIAATTTVAAPKAARVKEAKAPKPKVVALVVNATRQSVAKAEAEAKFLRCQAPVVPLWKRAVVIAKEEEDKRYAAAVLAAAAAQAAAANEANGGGGASSSSASNDTNNAGGGSGGGVSGKRKGGGAGGAGQEWWHAVEIARVQARVGGAPASSSSAPLVPPGAPAPAVAAGKRGKMAAMKAEAAAEALVLQRMARDLGSSSGGGGDGDQQKKSKKATTKKQQQQQAMMLGDDPFGLLHEGLGPLSSSSSSSPTASSSSSSSSSSPSSTSDSFVPGVFDEFPVFLDPKDLLHDNATRRAVNAPSEGTAAALLR